jgi:hypothetical protein
MRLFRQPKPRAWGEVIARAAADLARVRRNGATLAGKCDGAMMRAAIGL